MPNRHLRDQPESFSTTVILGTGDSSKTLVAAPGVGRALVIKRIVPTVDTAAAQKISVAAGTTSYMAIPASATSSPSFESERGLVGQENTALVATPALAGPSVYFFVEGYIKDLPAT